MIPPIKLGVIGRSSMQLCDGQTVKTRMLIDALKKKYPDAELFVADTYNYKKRMLPLLKDIFQCMKHSDIVFVLLSRNGMRVIFPILNSLNLFFQKPILHDIIGGNSVDLLNRYKSLRWHYKRFAVNWVESQKTALELKTIGIDNAAYLPNFKTIMPVSLDSLKKYNKPVFEFCTFSRVMAEKGIGQAARAVININAEAGQKKVALDIYGPIEPGYEEELELLISESEGAVSYRGVADPNDSVSILKNYFMLLFPTTFSGEGMPGTLIDALSAGIPIIATDWHYNGEIIVNERTGFLYAADKPWELEALMKYSIQNPDLIFSMKKQCAEAAENYSEEKAMRIINRKINEMLCEK